MRSIRLSLLLYFFVLLALALGAASVLAYRNMERTLQAKEESKRELLDEHFKAECHRVESKLDDALLRQARTLARVAWFEFEWGRSRFLLFAPLGMLSSGLDPNGQLFLPIWLAAHGRDSYFERLRQQQFVTGFHFDEDDLHRYVDGQVQVNEYFQINSVVGSIWRSRSLRDLSFSFDTKPFATTPLLQPQFEETVLPPGIAVRRVMYKVPVPHFRWEAWRYHNQPSRRPPPPPKPVEHNTGTIFIQCAAETSQRDLTLASLQGGFDDQLASLRAESQATLATLRNRLLLIGLATLAATVVGGVWLVRLGLSPLRRLSEAVSKVSAKDFRLPIDDVPLPRELRPIVQRLTQTLELLKRAFAREKQAAADISHELRTPLAALLTTIEVALRKPRATEEYRELLTDCQATGRQMSQLVERLLALARLDAGADTLRPREVDVAALAEQCTTLVRPLADARGLSLRIQRNGPVSMSADLDKLREILTNLLHNAIEYNRPNGSVEVAVEQQDGSVHLEVRDTGIGISPEARGHIFERFYRADPSRQAEGLHAGLGLAIVKGYVDLMGGQIDVQSTGEGSVFCIRFPAEAPPPS